MSIEVEGVFLHSNYTELISETFAKRYGVDLSKWIQPYGFFDHINESIISNGDLPAGTYVILGHVSYPGKTPLSYHKVFQFALCRSILDDLLLADPLSSYPDKPARLPLAPKYPMFRVGDLNSFIKGKKVVKQLIAKHLTVDYLVDKIQILEKDTIESNIYRLRLALQREIDKEKWLINSR